MSPAPALVRDTDHLRELLGIPYSEAQLAAITAGLDAPGVIIAGAGSGKTAVMAARVVWLVGHVGVEPERILGLTFTTKAAAELAQRVRVSLGRLAVELPGEPTTATYHAFAGSLIAEHGLRLGIEPDLRIVADASAFQRAARAIETYDGALSVVTTHVPTLVAQVVALDAALNEHLLGPEELRAFDADLIAHAAAERQKPAVLRDAALAAAKRSETSRLVDRYRELKRVDGVLDFADQMAGGARLAQLPDVGAALRERYDVVLLDEYQDTSVAQRDMLRGLFSGPDVEGGRGHPVSAVGDPAQAIYGWRGAAAGNLEGFLDDFPAADGSRGRSFSLNVTRRCAPRVIAAANDLAAEVYASSSTVRPLASAVEDIEGEVETSLHATVDDEIDHLVGEVARIPPGRRRDTAILVRAKAENGAIVAALRRVGVPFEIVGLDGLLLQPEVLDLLALLELVDDVTANPAVLRLLTGPRWRIGPRDLALLGRRAQEIGGRRPPPDEPTLADELIRAVEGTDPTEVVALADAVDDPGDQGYSAEARERFAELSAIVHRLRGHVGEPLLELARRAMRALDLDVELEAGGVTGAVDNLALFFEAVAGYAEADSYASLAGLIGYLRAEEEFADGLQVATPSEQDSVKLLTMHRAKGLEWDTVFLPLMAATVFPDVKGRPRWTTAASALPHELRGDGGSLPELLAWTTKDHDVFAAAMRDEAATEELRLGYVAYTRAARRLVLSGHWWGRTQKSWRGPSPFLERTTAWLRREYGVEPAIWAERPDDDASNPHVDQTDGVAWPAPAPELPGRRALAEAVREALAGAPVELPNIAPDETPDETIDEELARLDQIADDVDLLLAEADRATSDLVEVPWPERLSATAAMALREDPAAFAASLARPMPRRPSPQARFGTRFHAWVEDHYGATGLFEPTDLPGRGDTGIDSDAELERLQRAFLASEFAHRAPIEIEAPFSLALGGHRIGGRIDAVFRCTTPDGREGAEVVDWKTSEQPTADPFQLAIYRLAWAEVRDLDPAQVSGAFFYVRLGQTIRYAAADLPGRAELEAALGLGTAARAPRR